MCVVGVCFESASVCSVLCKPCFIGQSEKHAECLLHLCAPGICCYISTMRGPHSIPIYPLRLEFDQTECMRFWCQHAVKTVGPYEKPDIANLMHTFKCIQMHSQWMPMLKWYFHYWIHKYRSWFFVFIITYTACSVASFSITVMCAAHVIRTFRLEHVI